jgi:hypothetical protein
VTLAIAVVAPIFMAAYFNCSRPPLLLEDVRYMALPSGALDIIRPRLEAWLTQVFRVIGGYVLATGVLTVTLAVTSLRAHQQSAAIYVL